MGFSRPRLVEKNYYLHQSAREAYRAYILSYNSHTMKDSFNVHQLDLQAVAHSFGFSNPPKVHLPLDSKASQWGEKPSEMALSLGPMPFSSPPQQWGEKLSEIPFSPGFGPHFPVKLQLHTRAKQSAGNHRNRSYGHCSYGTQQFWPLLAALPLLL